MLLQLERSGGAEAEGIEPVFPGMTLFHTGEFTLGRAGYPADASAWELLVLESELWNTTAGTRLVFLQVPLPRYHFTPGWLLP